MIYVGGTAGPDTTIAGFTIRNGGADAVTVQSRANILYNHFDGSVDAIFYNSGGGLCSKNTFDGQIDDAIDLQDAVDVVIEDNIITNSHGNGIDIELNPYAGPVLNVVIRDNLIANNGLDGIQLIGWDAPTDRVYVIERNVIRENAMAGSGLVDGAQLIANNVEDYRGASLPERILLVNNTFIDNDVGVSGGDNLIALNNIFAGHPNSALSNVDGDSIAAHSLLWDNGENQVGSNIDAETTQYLRTRCWTLTRGCCLEVRPSTPARPRSPGMRRPCWTCNRTNTEVPRRISALTKLSEETHKGCTMGPGQMRCYICGKKFFVAYGLILQNASVTAPDTGLL